MRRLKERNVGAAGSRRANVTVIASFILPLTVAFRSSVVLFLRAFPSMVGLCLFSHANCGLQVMERHVPPDVWDSAGQW